jgi:hypothetical protein
VAVWERGGEPSPDPTFAVGDRVTVAEGLPGTVRQVDDANSPDAVYVVELDDDQGGGEWSADELTPLGGRTASVERTAADDYPELGSILQDRLPPPRTVVAGLRRLAGYWVDTPRSRRLEEMASALLTEANADRWQPDHPDEQPPYVELAGGVLACTAAAGPECRCCGGVGEHDTGKECYRCDASGQESAADPDDPVPCDGAIDMDTGELDALPEDERERLRSAAAADTSIQPEAGWVRDLLTPPTSEYSFDWCRFRRANHCWYPKELDAQASAQQGYAVWTPEDRGRCPRITWDQQRACPIGAPGPNAGGYTDATVPFGQGGQRGLPASASLRILDTGPRYVEDGGMSHTAALHPDAPVHHMLPKDDTAAAVAILRREVAARRGTTASRVGPVSTDGYVVVNATSHRAREKMLRELGPKQGHYSWQREGDFYLIPPASAERALTITGIKRVARPPEMYPRISFGASIQVTAGSYKDAIREHGGFTTKNHLGDGPAGGFMVSLDKDGEYAVPDDSFDDADVEEYKRRHARELAAPNAYLGAWHYDGKVYLDVSHHFDDEEEANRQAAAHDQIAYYDLAHGREVTTRQPQGMVASLDEHGFVAYDMPWVEGYETGRRPTVAFVKPALATAGHIREALGLDVEAAVDPDSLIESNGDDWDPRYRLACAEHGATGPWVPYEAAFADAQRHVAEQHGGGG